MKFEIFNDIKGEFRFRIIAANGEIIAMSEGYTTKQSVKDTIALIIKDVHSAEVVDHT